MTLSVESVQRQDELGIALERVVHELARASNQAAKSYDAYVAAMTRLAHLYASCGELLASAASHTAAPAVSPPMEGSAVTVVAAAATEARSLSARLTASTERWWRSQEEQRYAACLRQQREEWQRWWQEVTRTQQHNRSRQELLHTEAEAKAQLMAVEQQQQPKQQALQSRVDSLREELKVLNERVRHDITNNTKMGSKTLLKHSREMLACMAEAGLNMARCYQTRTPSTPSHSRAREAAAERENLTLTRAPTMLPEAEGSRANKDSDGASTAS